MSNIRFRELIQPGTNFEFVGKTRLWLTLSVIAVLFSIAMLPINHVVRGSALNFSIDFKGGTDIIMTFAKPVSAGDVRKAMTDAGHKQVDVSTFQFTDAAGKKQDAYLVRVPEFGALHEEQARAIADEFVKQSGGAQVVPKAIWSGDTFDIRSTKPIPEADLRSFLAQKGLEAKPWSPEQQKQFSAPIVGTNEYNVQVAVYGLDRNVQQALTKSLGTDVQIKQVDAVGAKAGEELRNDGIKSLLYAIALIMLYIAFRFDFRYGPGTVASLLHDAILTVGVFAVTWAEFSLTTVAAVLTVIGYSMNDTIVVFDRIRENEHKLKDKKFDRVINISVNETLSRTVLTSLATFVVTLAMNLLGTGLVKNFAFAMNIGIIVGTYSTIFVAAPVLLWLNERYFARRPVASTRRPAPAESV
jgi:preprotein translocase subunit SecF